MIERKKAALKFLVPHEELAKAVEPVMAHLDHPSSHLLLGVAPSDVRLPVSIDHVPSVAMVLTPAENWVLYRQEGVGGAASMTVQNPQAVRSNVGVFC